MIFYEVCRRGKRYDDRTFGKVLIQTDNRERAERIYEKATIQTRVGAVYLLADGLPQRHYHAGWNRSRW